MAEKFEHKKSLGQHFLTSPVVPGWMCDAAAITPGEVVLEIGPGTGVLTAELLERGATVYALEADSRAIESLSSRFQNEIAASQLTVYHADVRDFSWDDIPVVSGQFKVVANIPYYLSGLLFRTMLAGAVQPSTLVFLVQKEVARRATASRMRGEKESLLSLSVKIFGEPTYIKTVSRGHFTPPPKVDSGIIAVRNISRDKLAGLDMDFFFICLHLGFGQKRKQLLGNLATTYDRSTLETIFTGLELPLTVRAEDVSVEEWVALTQALSQV